MSNYTLTKPAYLTHVNGSPIYCACAIRNSDGRQGRAIWRNPNMEVTDGSDACNWDCPDEFELFPTIRKIQKDSAGVPLSLTQGGYDDYEN